MFRAQQPIIMANPQPYSVSRNLMTAQHTIIGQPTIMHQPTLIGQPTIIAHTKQAPYIVRDPRFLAPIAPIVQYVVPEKKKKPAPEPAVIKVFDEKKEEKHHPKYYEPYYK